MRERESHPLLQESTAATTRLRCNDVQWMMRQLGGREEGGCEGHPPDSMCNIWLASQQFGLVGRPIVAAVLCWDELSVNVAFLSDLIRCQWS